jgi:hypothetical protein
MSLGDPRKTCPHRATEVVFPDGTRVLASASWIYRPEIAADVVLYLDESWAPYGEVIDWPDGSVPRDHDAARRLIREGFAAAGEGRRVEVGCIAGHGRTGTVLACMAILAGVGTEDAIDWVREHYCSKAVETGPQEWWIGEFGRSVAAAETP